MAARKKAPTKRQEDRQALRDLSEEQLYEDISKLPEFIEEMKQLKADNRRLKEDIRQGDRYVKRLEREGQRLQDQLKKLEGKLKNSIPAPVVEPKPGESDFTRPAGFQGGPFNCRRCGGKVRKLVTSKNRKEATVEANGVRGQQVSHRMRNTFQCAWGFDAAGEYITVRTDEKFADPQTRVYEYHSCGRD